MSSTNESWKRLFLDIETSPNVGIFFAAGYDQSIHYDNILVERKIICICWKWEGKSGVESITWDENQDDKALLKAITKVIQSADEVIGHNIDKYDLAFISGRLAYHELPGLGPILTTDTLKQSRGSFYINSHRLDYLGKYLKAGKKIETGGMGLWKRVLIDKCNKALKEMVTYCKQDVILLENVHAKIQKYVKNPKHLGRAMSGNVTSCKLCGHEELTKYGSYYTSNGLKQQKYQCKSCGHVGKHANVVMKVTKKGAK